MVTTQGLERQESKESTPGLEEEEQCRRSRHQVMRRRSSVSWAWMLKKQEGHGFIWKEHRYWRSSQYQ